MFLGSPVTGDIKFSNRSFYYIEQFKVDIHFANFWQVKIDPIRFFFFFLLTGHSYFTEFEQAYHKK